MPDSNVSSPLIETVTEADLLAILQASLAPNIELKAYRQLTGGLFNTSYLLETGNPARKVILRIAPSEKMHHTLFDYETTMMQSEPAVYTLMRQNGLAVPNVIALDATGTVIPRQYILLDYLDTVPMNHPSVPTAAKPALQYQLGAYLKRMHSITHNKFGRLQSDGTVNGDGSWQQVFEPLFHEAVQKCRDHHLIDSKTLDRAEEAFAKHNHALNDPELRPALIHGDMWDANVLVAQDNTGIWQIVAIIDVDRAMFADPMFDACLWYNTDDFLAGYGEQNNISEAAQVRFNLYHLYQDLFHLFVFGIQIPIPKSRKHHHASTHKFVERLS